MAYATFHKNLSDTAVDKDNTHTKVPPEGEKKNFLYMMCKHVGRMPVYLTFQNTEAPNGTPSLSKTQVAQTLLG